MTPNFLASRRHTHSPAGELDGRQRPHIQGTTLRRKATKGNKKVDGLVVGNIEDKSALRNPISRYLVRSFDTALLTLLHSAAPKSLHEVGCGECRLTALIRRHFDIPVRATD
jgi:hypothetical protein